MEMAKGHRCADISRRHVTDAVTNLHAIYDSLHIKRQEKTKIAPFPDPDARLTPCLNVLSFFPFSGYSSRVCVSLNQY